MNNENGDTSSRPEQITGDCTDCYDVGYVLESSGDREYWKPCHCDRGMAYDSAFDLQPRARDALQNAYLDIRSLRVALAEIQREYKRVKK